MSAGGIRPSWAGKPKLPPVQVPAYESAESFPGWKLVGDDDFYSCVWPADYAPDPAALAFIRSFHPEVVPMIRRQLWIRPNSREVVTVLHWCFGHYVWHPSVEMPKFHVEMPADADFHTPNWIDCVFEDKDPREDGPGGYLPFDMRMAHTARRGYDEGFDKFRIDEVFRRRRDRIAEARRKWIEEGARKQAELDRLVDRWGEDYTEADRGAEVAKRMRRLEELRAKGSTRPFVFLGGS